MLLDRVGVAVRGAEIAPSGATLVVGVSGGPDSLALLDLLSRQATPQSFRLHVAHLDHRLRADSADDARFVLGVAERLGIPATIETADVSRLATERHLGIEQAARGARYAFFARIVAETGAWGVALGHTADDQVETIILALVRGAGPGGLRGMRVVSARPVGDPPTELQVFRPLLDVSRVEIESYLRERGIEPLRDPTNAETTFRRNRIRHEVIPALRAINPRVGEAVRRLGQLAEADEEYFRRRVAELWPVVADARSGTVRLRRSSLAALPSSLSSRLLRQAYVVAVGDPLELEAIHVEAARELLASDRTGGSLDWPRGVVVRLEYEWLVFERTNGRAGEALPAEGVKLMVPGTAFLPTGDRVVARLTQGACRWEYTGHDHADFDLDRVGQRLTIRRRRPGDRLMPLGMRGEKKVQDLLVDAKVPRAERDLVPIVEGAEGIVWVAGVRADERYRVEADTRDVLCLRMLRCDPETPQR